MATGNIILGTATGSIGDVTLMRRAGKQVSRVRVRKIGNPKTANQAANRALLNTLGTAYGYLRGIVDHSFQGKSGPLANMREFLKLNQGVARATGSVSPSGTDEGYNFNFKGETVMRPNPLKIASGTLPGVEVKEDISGSPAVSNGFKFKATINDGMSYNEVVNALGLMQGDQLTFIGIADPEFVGPRSSSNQPRSYGTVLFARVILEPSDKDMESIFINNGEIDAPNAKNEGIISFDEHMNISLTKLPAANFIAMGVIVSRYDGGQWKRSNCQMLVGEDYVSSNTMSEVYESYMLSEEVPSSDLYLNQALS